MRPLATLLQSSLITESRPSWKKHLFMGIAIFEGVCGGASNFTNRDIRNDIIIVLHRVGACRAGQRVKVICVIPKRKEKSFFSWRSFLLSCYNLLCQRVNKLHISYSLPLQGTFIHLDYSDSGGHSSCNYQIPLIT